MSFSRSISARVLLLLLSATVAMAALSPFVVQASGGPIQVVQTEQKVNYPRGVGLSATIESEADVAEVRVYYRPAGSRRWGYAYADFDPGTRVVATQSIPVRESTYIAPGANVEYFYEIRDVRGNVFRTESSFVEYLDQRFDWERVSIGPLELIYHDIDRSRVDQAARELRDQLGRVEALLQLDQPGTFKGVIYNKYSDANAAFPVQSQTTTDHGTFAGYAFSEQRVFVGQGLDSRIIVHESAHLMLSDALGRRSIDLPDWLNEGFATYVEPNVRVRSSNELYGRTPDLRGMRNLSGTPETIPLFYYKSVSVVAHLIENYGQENFRRLLAELKRGRNIEAALINVYGFDDHGLDNSWAGLPIPDLSVSTPVHGSRFVHGPGDEDSDADRDRNADAGSGSDVSQPTPASPPGGRVTPIPPQRQPRPQEDGRLQVRPTQSSPAQPGQPREEPSPFIYFDVWILAGAALLAAAVVGLRFVYRRIRRENESPGDPWDEWPPEDRFRE